MKVNHLPKFLLLVIFSGLLWSCKEEVEPIVEPDATLEENINAWIYDVMDEVYYWRLNLQTPVAATSDPSDYFNSLLFKPTDRFSVIYPDYQVLINSLQGISLDPGYEFQLYRITDTNDIYAEILYVKKNSPAAGLDLKRGDRILSINGTPLTIENYRNLLGQTTKTHTISNLRYDDEARGYIARPDISITPVEFSEDPNFLDTVYTVNDQKIGYIVYNFFAPGVTGDNTKYDKEMDAVFAKMKAANINNLVLDLRYNGGGYVSSAVNLASLIGPGVTSSNIFSKTRYNTFLMENIPSLSSVKTAFLNKAENLGNTLAGNRLYVLTSSGTASASELIINGLKPYMDVFLIGDVTYGKNVGSIAIEDEENPNNPYGLLPIVTQSFNSLDESDYSTGFKPNVTVKENTERLKALGDVNEIMLRTAIERITGVPSSGRFAKFEREVIVTTLEDKIRTGKMIENSIIK
ncbi:C-terminal processing protease CtpA/Prc [Algoriphagus ratkowskyi]|uniref:C-terminal processing protease CtpA/Prc n=1 Tax=Algoriphagus ratkowskyi TaxID=57028 RepID=A0A2W7RCH4_9BACT|nr:S41 family peptidase [Algoriphagus ratkowskyi]PZX56030.1 C-terminal processing protease CtpA/Prc [Algoriphagus ratkowskyi]TXD77161.1 peptidase [Algoriphagus ratkowskyi]